MSGLRNIGLAAVTVGLLVVGGAGAVSSDTSFSTGVEGGGVAVQPSTGKLFIYDDLGTIFVYSPAGSLLQSFAWPQASGNDADLDFVNEATSIGGTAVASGSLLVAAGDQNQVYVLNPANGAVLVGPLALPTTHGSGDVDGIAYDAARNSIWVVHWSTDIVEELALNDLHVLQFFPAQPAGSPAFDVFYGDIDVSPFTGRLYLDGSSQSTIRELTTSGAFSRDLDVSSIVTSSPMAGLAIEDGAANRAWVSTTNGRAIHLLGLDNASPVGSVLAWGCGNPNNYGQCNVPAGALVGVSAVSAGSGHTLALKSGGVLAWGCSGFPFGECTVPASATSGVSAIAAGSYHSLALKNGGVLAWGCSGNNYGQCTVPAGATSGVVAIAAGETHSLALKSDGSVVAWGCVGFDFGQCTVPAGAGSLVIGIAASVDHSLALRNDGSVIAWGCSGPNAGECAVPAGAGSGVIAIAAGEFHSLALKSTGSVIAWGCTSGNPAGECVVPAAAGSGVTAIAAGYFHNLALKSDGSVISWGCGGSDNFGQCTVPGGATSGMIAIDAAYAHSVAVHLTPPTGVTLRAFWAAPSASGTVLRWRTANELQTLGFNVYRARHGHLAKLNRGLIPGVFGGTTMGRDYSFVDRNRRRGIKSTYRLQAVGLDGRRAWLGTAVATGRG